MSTLPALFSDTAPELPVSDPSAFARRRARAAEVFSRRGISSAIFFAGWARPRNFAHNVFPFRAESHFLWFLGRNLEGACLVFSRGQFELYAAPPEPDLELWAGPQVTLSQLEEDLGLGVRPLGDLEVHSESACLPPQDDETAEFASGHLGRTILAQSGAELTGRDAELAEALVELRLAHDEAGLAQMRFAIAVSARAHRLGMAVSRDAGAESQVRAVMEAVFTAHGLQPAYTSIVTVHGEILHADTSRRALSPHDLLLCDLGAESPEGYASDITRTWPVSGRFSPTQRDAYELVLEVQRRAIAAARVGVPFADVHLIALSAMAEGLVDLKIARCGAKQCFDSGLAAVFFPHGLGHLLGLDVHDMEDLGDRAGYGDEGSRLDHPAFSPLRLLRRLRENMVVTIEPGFYQVPFLIERALSDSALRQLIDVDRLETFADVRGIRIEDDVLIESAGATVLSSDVPKSVDDIEALMNSGP